MDLWEIPTTHNAQPEAGHLLPVDEGATCPEKIHEKPSSGV